VAKGKVSMEELRGQLGERMPGAFQAAAKAMGVTTAELDKLVSSGKVTAEELLPKMAEEMEKTFGGGVIDSMTTNMNQIENAVTAIAMKVGKALNPVLKVTAEILSDIAGTTEEGVLRGQADEMEKERKELGFLIEAITDVNTPNERRLRLLNSLEKEYPKFLGNLSKEAVTNGQLTSRLKEVNSEYLKNIKLRINQAEIVEKEKQLMEAVIRERELAAGVQKLEERVARTSSKERGIALSKLKNTKDALKDINTLQKDLSDELDVLTGKSDALIKAGAVAGAVAADVDSVDKVVDEGKITESIANTVRGVSGQVKNITVNVDAIQKIDTQNVNDMGDLESFGVQLEELLARITLDLTQK